MADKRKRTINNDDDEPAIKREPVEAPLIKQEPLQHPIVIDDSDDEQDALNTTTSSVVEGEHDFNPLHVK